MRKYLLVALTLLCGVAMVNAQLTKGLSRYQLDNGLTVMLWEDHEKSDVTGYVVVRAGAVDEPGEYTGLAHYLEHMLFKGTQTIGALNWEQEQPIYDSIVALYDQYCETTDPTVREKLATLINECSMREAKISSTEDFFNLMDLIGAEGVNAFTSYDLTCYHNSFPAAEMLRWLTIFSDRLIHPVFRTFQAELENVFEEYNMYANNPANQVRNTLFKEIYKGCPYERDVIGLPEHLKNPRLSKLIEFYNTWYVANNMALVLVGDFDTEAVKPMIESTFSRIEAKPLPERPTYAETILTGKQSYKMGYQPQIVWTYPGCTVTDKDQITLEFVCALLSNGQTGLLDKLNIDGEVSSVYASCDNRRSTGRIIIQAIPYYDANQQMFESNNVTEKIVMAQVDKLKNGIIDEKTIASVKKMYDIAFKLNTESSSFKTGILVQSFAYGKDVEDYLKENEVIQSLTLDQIVNVAKKYFSADRLMLSFDEGTVKANTLPKPKIKPLDPVKDAHTAYAAAFKQLPKGEIKQTYNNFADVTVSTIDNRVTLHYTPNTKNDIFSLTLRYGVGKHEMPMLPYAAALLEDAGVMPSTDPQDLQRQFADMGAAVSYDCDNSYFYITVRGEDANWNNIMNLISRQLLMPKMEQKKLDAVKGSIFYSRLSRTKQTSVQKSALLTYALYGDKSPYIDEVKFGDVWTMSLGDVTSQIAKARTYALDVFYCGTKTPQEIHDALPLTEGMRESSSPYVQERISYDKPTILFLPNSSVQQADLYFYVNGKPYSIADEVSIQAFNQYFSGGFSGLVLNEIRCKRSMAYSAYGQFNTPILQDKPIYFIGYVGTQSDKVVDAIDVYMDLVQNMPANSENIEGIRASLKQVAQSTKPDMRSKAALFDIWQRLGFTDDPYKMMASQLDAFDFSAIQSFYDNNLKGQNVTIILMGDPKKIDLKAIETRMGCKVTKLTTGKLFAPLDTDF